MKNILINNTTNNTIILENSNERYEIMPNCRQKITIDKNKEFRVYRSKTYSSKLSVGQFLSKETLRNIWIIGPAIRINLDSFIDVSSGKIDISERKYHMFYFLIFNLFVFNNEIIGFYNYHKNADKRKIQFFCLFCLIPLSIISPLLVIGCIYGIINDFSAETVIASLIGFIPLVVVIGLAKSAHSLMKIDNKLKNEQDKLKQVNIFLDKGWFIKFSEK